MHLDAKKELRRKEVIFTSTNNLSSSPSNLSPSPAKHHQQQSSGYFKNIYQRSSKLKKELKQAKMTTEARLVSLFAMLATLLLDTTIKQAAGKFNFLLQALVKSSATKQFACMNGMERKNELDNKPKRAPFFSQFV